jgi:hypothetical protein
MDCPQSRTDERTQRPINHKDHLHRRRFDESQSDRRVASQVARLAEPALAAAKTSFLVPVGIPDSVIGRIAIGATK